MNRNISPRLARSLALSVSKAEEMQNQVRDTPQAERYRQEQAKLAKKILKAADSAKSVEDLIHLEVALQNLDEKKARSEQDKTGIENAKRDYVQICDTVKQMRTNPEEYFMANQSFKETGGDFHKMPRGRGLQQLNGNKTRMQNRASFANEEDKKVWDARIVVAKKTESMLKALHNDLAANHERNIKTQKQLEQR